MSGGVLEQDLLAAVDPCALAERAGLALDPWQRDALRSRAPRALWNVARQCGKSSVSAVLACHRALYTEGALVLLISPSERQSKELMAKVLQVYQAAGCAVAADAETRLTLELTSGSRVVALPGAERTVRGYSSPALVVIDEAARVEDGLFYALSPMLATRPDAQLLAVSTPAGQLGWWHQCWTEGGALWERVRITAAQCPRISAHFLATERASLPAATYAQEYECVFSAIQDGAFLPEDVYAMVSEDVLPRFPALAAALAGGEDANVDITPYLS